MKRLNSIEVVARERFGRIVHNRAVIVFEAQIVNLWRSIGRELVFQTVQYVVVVNFYVLISIAASLFVIKSQYVHELVLDIAVCAGETLVGCCWREKVKVSAKRTSTE